MRLSTLRTDARISAARFSFGASWDTLAKQMMRRERRENRERCVFLGSDVYSAYAQRATPAARAFASQMAALKPKDTVYRGEFVLPGMLRGIMDKGFTLDGVWHNFVAASPDFYHAVWYAFYPANRSPYDQNPSIENVGVGMPMVFGLSRRGFFRRVNSVEVRSNQSVSAEAIKWVWAYDWRRNSFVVTWSRHEFAGEITAR